MSTDRDAPDYLDSSFLRGLTQSRMTRRTALKGAGALSFAGFLAACGIGNNSTSSTATHTNWVWDKATQAGVLDFANWPLYMDTSTDAAGNTTYPSLIEFTKETGIKVNYSEVIQDDDSWFAKIAPQLAAYQPIGYDLMVVTNGKAMTYLQLRNWLVELDPSKLPNFFKNAAPRLLSRQFDVGNKFTIPWQSGFTGIGYNPKKTGREITSFQDLFDPAFHGHVGMFVGNEDTGNLTLLGMGVKPQDSTPADWQKAADKLKQARDSGIVRKFYDQSYIHALSQGDTWISMAWSGDIFQANLSAGSEVLKFVVPKEGGVIWTDNMCIPVGAPHPLDAITYMNYVYNPKVAAQLAEGIEYITPVPAAQPIMVADAAAATDPSTKATLTEVSQSPLVFPSPDDFARSYYYRVLSPVPDKSGQSETDQWNKIFDAVITA